MSGGRILFLDFTCVDNACTITAPPNAFVSPPVWYQLFVFDELVPSHSAWVRIGGDLGKLGNRLTSRISPGEECKIFIINVST